MLTHQLESLNLLLKALFFENCPARSVILTPSVLTESSLRRPPDPFFKKLNRVFCQVFILVKI